MPTKCRMGAQRSRVARWGASLLGGMVILSGGVAGDSATPSVHSFPDRVILLHGMGRSARSMSRMAAFLSAHGLVVINHDYPSTRKSAEALSQGLEPLIQGCVRAAPQVPIHIVTHSLGGIVIRQYLETHTLPAGSRIVMLSPPNQGSEIADWLNGWRFYRWLMGPAGQQLGTGAEALPQRLGAPHLPVGVIAGDRSLEPWFSARIPGPNDGKVSVARTRLAGMTDFLIVHRSHGFIMRAPEVLQQTLFFLRHGRFKKPGEQVNSIPGSPCPTDRNASPRRPA